MQVAAPPFQIATYELTSDSYTYFNPAGIWVSRPRQHFAYRLASPGRTAIIGKTGVLGMQCGKVWEGVARLWRGTKCVGVFRVWGW